MAWYDDEDLLTYEATYKNGREASKDARRAAKRGWEPQEAVNKQGALDIIRDALKVATLGPAFRFSGASRTLGDMKIKYVRTPEWLKDHGRG